MVPTARASDPGVSQAKLVVAMCAELRAEGGAKQNATTRINLAVSWFQLPLACSRLMARLFDKFRRKQSTTEPTQSDSLMKYLALAFTVVRSLAGVPTHLQDKFW